MMDITEARKILGDIIQTHGSLYKLGSYIYWDKDRVDTVVLDGDFTLDEIEAVTVYIRWSLKNDSQEIHRR